MNKHLHFCFLLVTQILLGCGEEPTSYSDHNKSKPVNQTPKSITLTIPFWLEYSTDLNDLSGCEMYSAKRGSSDNSYSRLYQLWKHDPVQQNVTFFFSNKDGAVQTITNYSDKIHISKSDMGYGSKFQFFNVRYVKGGTDATISFSYNFIFNVDFPADFHDLVLSSLIGTPSIREYELEFYCYNHLFDDQTQLNISQRFPFFGTEGHDKYVRSSLDSTITTQYNTPDHPFLKYSVEPYFMYDFIESSGDDPKILPNPTPDSQMWHYSFAYDGEEPKKLTKLDSSVTLTLKGSLNNDFKLHYGVSYDGYYYNPSIYNTGDEVTLGQRAVIPAGLDFTYSLIYTRHGKPIFTYNDQLPASNAVISSSSYFNIKLSEFTSLTWLPTLVDNKINPDPNLSALIDSKTGYQRLTFNFTSNDSAGLNSKLQIYSTLDDEIYLPDNTSLTSQYFGTVAHKRIDVLLTDDQQKGCFSPQDFTQLFRADSLNGDSDLSHDYISVADSIPNSLHSLSRFHTCRTLLLSIDN